ncbi:MAG TPA: hypothetical protein VFV99_09875, partial [Kofleriaceae bacterium]|nr:hypothetical protein [Kofleriaceae bacterium]
WSIAFLAVLGVAACTHDEEVATESDGFVIEQHDAHVFNATVTSAGSSLRVMVNETQTDIVDVTFDFGDPVIGFHLDYTKGLGEFQPNGAPLDAAQSRLLAQLYDQLTKMPEMLANKQTRVDEVAFRMANFMQIVPTGEALASHNIVAQQGWVHISCTCGNQYIGSGYYRIAGRHDTGIGGSCSGGSGNGCKGRCGASCYPCAGTTAYTQDCAKHDWGVGSFAAASDDFSFASNNCSC